MNKILNIFLVSFALNLSAIPNPPDLGVGSYILYEPNTGKVLVSYNADEPVEPASLTKLMTSSVIADYIKEALISLADEPKISIKAWKTEGSRMFIREGKKVPVSELIKGMIIQSGNDASIALAEHISGGEIAFADLMNQQAELLQMTNSEFKKSSGLPEEGMYSSARDLSKIANAIIKDHPTSYKIYSEKYFKHNNINQPNRNRLLWRDKSVDGLKTGRTDEAGFCLVASAEREDMRLISVSNRPCCVKSLFQSSALL